MKHIISFILTIILIMTIHSVNAQTNSSSTEIIRYTIPTEQHAHFEEAYQQAGKLLDASTFCKGYEVIHGEEEPDHYIVVIYWTSTEDHMNGFRNSPQFMPFFDLVKPFYNHIEEMKHYKKVFGGTKP